MSNTLTNERKFRREAQEYLNNCLNILTEHICVLLSKIDPESMKLTEREQAAMRHLMFKLRLLQLHQKYVQASSTEEKQAIYEEILQALRERGM